MSPISLSCRDDAEASERAVQILEQGGDQERWRYDSVEVWDRMRVVARCAKV